MKIRGIVFQILLTFTLSMFLYMTYALLDSDYGIDGLAGLLFIEPVFGAVLTMVTILCCLLIGLPFRLNGQLNSWIRKNAYLALSGIVLGIILLFIAYVPLFMESKTYCIGEDEVTKNVPNTVLCFTGWLLVNFSALHTYFPEILTARIKRFLKL